MSKSILDLEEAIYSLKGVGCLIDVFAESSTGHYNSSDGLTIMSNELRRSIKIIEEYYEHNAPKPNINTEKCKK